MNCPQDDMQTTEDQRLLHIHSKLVTSQRALNELLVRECGKDNYNVEVRRLSAPGFKVSNQRTIDETRRVLYKISRQLQDIEYGTY